MQPSACRICGNPVEEKTALLSEAGSPRTASRVRCARCGTYDISYMLEAVLDKHLDALSQDERYHLSGITRMATERGEVEELTTSTYRDLLDTTPQPSPIEQAILLLQYLAKRYKPGKAPVPINPNADYPVVSALGPSGLSYITKSLLRDGLIEAISTGQVNRYRVTMRGFERLAGEPATMFAIATGEAGWHRVEREIRKAREALASAKDEEDFQMASFADRR